MVVRIPDKFYEPYSFSVDFGYPSTNEVDYIKMLLQKCCFSPSDTNVLSTLEFIRDFSKETRTIANEDIKEIKNATIEEKITGGFIPPDIQISYQTLQLLLQIGIVTIAGLNLIDKFSGDRISKATSSAIIKLQKDKKGKKIIAIFLKKIKRASKTKSKSTTKKLIKRKKTQRNRTVNNIKKIRMKKEKKV